MKSKTPNPPKFFLDFFRWFCHPDIREDIEGDLLESFNESVKSKGYKKARLLLVWDVLQLFRPGIIRSFSGTYRLNHYGRFKSFFVLTYRHFIKTPLTALIQLFGMTVGLTIFLLVLLWIFQEVGYDKFNKHADRIYRLEISSEHNNNMVGLTTTIATIIKDNIPEVEKTVRLRHWKADQTVLKLDNEQDPDFFRTGEIVYADNDFFEIFSFDFIKGDPKNALKKKNSAVITESLAKNMYGYRSPIGEQISVGKGVNFTITGVIRDVPNFHVDFKMIRSFKTHQTNDTWWYWAHPTYLLINENHDVTELEQKIAAVLRPHFPEGLKDQFTKFDCHLRPLKDIYFSGGEAQEAGYAQHGDYKKVIAYAFIAFFTLLLACINLINLSNAKFLERAKEVGIKRVSGASRSQIFLQFLGETSLLCFISLVLALAFTFHTLQWFNNLMDSKLLISNLLEPSIVTSILIGLVMVCLVSGGFPALYVLSFRPVKVLKGLNVSKGFTLKKLNLVIQFAVTIFLLIGTITVLQQVNYMKNADPGFAREQQVYFSFNGNHLERLATLKETLQANPNILAVSSTEAIPGTYNLADNKPVTIIFNGTEYKLAGTPADDGFVDALGLKVVAGRFFDKAYKADNLIQRSDELSSEPINIVLNESAVRAIGLEEPIGATGKFPNGGIVQVIGIINDYHMNSLENHIPPTFYTWSRAFAVVVRITPFDIPNTVNFMDKQILKLSEHIHSDIQFIDDVYNKQYQKDENFAELMMYFTLLTFVIAGMGLFGVSTFTVKVRVKEIGIRKSMGASAYQIFTLLTKAFIIIVLIAALLAIPVAWMSMDNWLNNYAYRVDLKWWFFVGAGAVALVIVVLTVALRTVKAAKINPALCLRYE
ncbi:ABC transporter permease [Fulvivirgaceae bacterium BMA10]|uniref:ABC transporter permease n=1 Tax=Splendidivirga corallicola TaxID=3051826 RepID=A0ABT8KJV0_9BACT|nr:ABC transporter permease [Fulvivirgaceae bacterium BMA10]